MRAAFQSDESLRETLKEVLGELGLSAREFSKVSAIPQSTLYKILSGHREPNITTLRQIVKTIQHAHNLGYKYLAARGEFVILGCRGYLAYGGHQLHDGSADSNNGTKYLKRCYNPAPHILREQAEQGS